jgi:hypothetical protein
MPCRKAQFMPVCSITGGTSSTAATFPVTVGPDLTYNGASYDAFVAKVSTTAPSFNLYLPLILR